VRDTAFALVASTIGGELIALPYAMSHMGLYFGILAIVGIGYLSHVSSMMYLKVGDLVPGHHKSVYELAYALSGRSAIFVVCIVQYFLNFFKIVLYYMIIGDTFSQLFQQLFMEDTTDMSLPEKKSELTIQPIHARILGEKATHILLVGLGLLTIIFMRKLRELKIVSYMFVVATVVFLVLLSVELIAHGKHPETTFATMTEVTVDHHLITAFNILVVAFNV